jgi:hypothetical protein
MSSALSLASSRADFSSFELISQITILLISAKLEMLKAYLRIAMAGSRDQPSLKTISNGPVRLHPTRQKPWTF